MPTGYRIELSPNKRAGCNNSECKKAGVKIQKDEVRFATMVTIQEKSSWQYKHWGCVTPVVLSNISEFIGGDFEMIDGFEDLPEDWQDKVKRAIEQGHVDDEDWKGDVEKNRPGMKGFRLTQADRKRMGLDEDDDEKPKKKRGRKSADDDDSEEEAPPPKKSRAKKGAAAKRAEEEEEPAVDEEEAPAPKKARGKKATKAAKAEDEDEAEEAPVKPKRGRPSKKAAPKSPTPVVEDEAEQQLSVEEEEEPVAPKPKKSRAKKTDDEPKAAPKAKRGKAKAAPVVDENGADEANEADEVSAEEAPKKKAPQKRGRKAKA